MKSPKYHIFVCTGCRLNGTMSGFCYQKGAVNLVQKFMEQIDELELSGDCVVNNTGCFRVCEKGPVCVVYPEGIWYGGLDEEAVERICEEHFGNGVPVKDYMI